MKQKHNQTKQIVNKRASFDYSLGDAINVGIELLGSEVKALRLGQGNLRGAYVTVKDDQLWLINCKITGTNGVPIDVEKQSRTRKLLANRKEIDELISQKNQGQTIVPLKIIVSGRFIKLKISAGKGKKQYDKRQTLKERDEKRTINMIIKQKR